jgi:hypothetical protein|tara:strand:- start:457 stop:810 length:354 start_codon:yes stop_codon:yes gene_type:complete
MELINISKKGTQKFKLKDGRFILSYPSGYVRIDSGLDRLYQINKTRKRTEDFKCWSGEITKVTYTERVLIPCPNERFEFIKDWVKRNVVNVPYSMTRELRNKTNWLKHYKKYYKYNG